MLYVYPVSPDIVGTNGVYGSGSKKILICALILYAALLTANSRGGYLALTAGFLFFFSLLRWQILKEYRHRFLIIIAGFAAVTLIFHLLGFMGLSGWDTDRVVDTFKYGDHSYRKEL